MAGLLDRKRITFHQIITCDGFEFQYVKDNNIVIMHQMEIRTGDPENVRVFLGGGVFLSFWIERRNVWSLPARLKAVFFFFFFS